MFYLYLIQTFLPLLLIAWLAFAPPLNTIGFWVQVIGTATGLVAQGNESKLTTEFSED